MHAILRRARGLTGLGLTWGTAWGGIGAGIGLVIAALSPGVGWLSGVVEQWALGMGAYGFVSGVGFGKLLWFLEGRRTLDELPLGRVAAWGALGGAVVPLLFGLGGFFEVGTTAGDVAGAVAVTAGLGGLFAAGSVALARRDRDDTPGAELPGELSGDRTARPDRTLAEAPVAGPIDAARTRSERTPAR